MKKLIIKLYKYTYLYNKLIYNMSNHTIYELNECFTSSGYISSKCAIHLDDNKYIVKDNVSIRTHSHGYRWPVLRFAREELKATFLLKQGTEFTHDKKSESVYAEKYKIESVKFKDERFYDKYLSTSTYGDFATCLPYSMDFLLNVQFYDLSDPKESFYYKARTSALKP